MRKYELTYLVSDEVPENDLNKVTGKVTGFVNELGGKLTKEDIWGRRKLAYPIKKMDFATYVTLYFDLPANKAVEFERELRQIEGVIRQLMIVKDIVKEEITLTKEDIADAGEIKNVIGGDRSFEALEGETAESRNLMAKREDLDREPAIVEVEKAEETKPAKAEKPAASVEDEAGVPASAKSGMREKKPAKAEAKTETKTKKTVSKKDEPSAPKAALDKKMNDEVARLSKLNEELDDILKDEL